MDEKREGRGGEGRGGEGRGWEKNGGRVTFQMLVGEF
jgi:hypothetical protein